MSNESSYADLKKHSVGSVIIMLFSICSIWAFVILDNWIFIPISTLYAIWVIIRLYKSIVLRKINY